MVNLKINNKNISVPFGTTILNASKAAGFSIPKLCYLKELNEIGACRVCSIEIEGVDKLVTSCNNFVSEGMKIHTNTLKVREARKANVSLILSQHDFRCATCIRSNNCSLQKIATDIGILSLPFHNNFNKEKWKEDFPLIRNSAKCIKCMRCIQICSKVQSLNVWDLLGTGAQTSVGVSNNKNIEESNCSLCGQCITHCPVGALSERNDIDKIFNALNDPEKITIIQIAPAIRTSWAEGFDLPKEFKTLKRLVAGVKKIGFDYVFDTGFSADLTIMEEASEFIQKLKNKDIEKFPIFTSCCPAWVRFLKSEYPDMIDQLSTAKSPQQMFGSVAKTYYAKMLNVTPDKIFSISIMPCLAKKDECENDLMILPDNISLQYVDASITTRELQRMMRSEQIIISELPEEEFDTPFGFATGAGIIFGATGGVMEAALRTAHYLITNTNPEFEAFKDVRGGELGYKKFDFKIAGIPVKTAVVHGLKNARELIEELRKGIVDYDFVEVMACPGGCTGGGGQPIKDGTELANSRAKTLYKIDKESNFRFSHENPSIIKCYENFFKTPLSDISHHLLHTKHKIFLKK
ncbi:MAG: [FeFe] hydrogenase, group A [Fusobacteriaceae bacterium]